MDQVILMRHAKSSWHDRSLDDHDRPLNKRGRKAAIAMANTIIAKGLRPGAIICSTALRTRRTLAPLLELIVGKIPVCYSPALYSAGPGDYIELIKNYGLETNLQSGPLMLVGHNFAIQDAALLISRPSEELVYRQMEEKFPSGATALLELNNGFSSCAPACADLIDYIRPCDLD